MKGYLVLENGEIFEGIRFGYDRDVICEVVFNSAMTGYIEIFTDPSCAGQGLVMTYPLIGNYGVINEDAESKRIWASAIFIHELAEYESNFRTNKSLEIFLKENKIPGLKNVNTRKLTKTLRDNGTMRGMVTSNIENLDEIIEKIKAYKIGNVLEYVTSKTAITYASTRAKQIALIDYGSKDHIINSLLKRNVAVTVYPVSTPIEIILATRPDGIMLSNGPGDPNDCLEQVEVVKKIYKTNIPIMGIGLGHQLMGLANGFKVQKLKYGHRGASHPIREIKTNRVYATSQNHGYVISKDSINSEVAEVSYVSLNDDTIEGLKYKDKNIITVQFYPDEGSEYIYDEFIDMVNGGNK